MNFSKSIINVISESISQLGLKHPENNRIVMVAAFIQNLLRSKNKAYGNSAFEPVRIFSKASPIEGISVCIDDKLSRIAQGGLKRDTVIDLIGYLILLTVKADEMKAWKDIKE